MKKILTIIICVLLSFSLIGCGQSSSNDKGENIEKQSEETSNSVDNNSKNNNLVKKVEFDFENLTMCKGDEVKVYAVVTMANGSRNQDVVWETSDPDIAEVHQGNIYAHSLGEVDITVYAKKDGTKKDVLKVEVRNCEEYNSNNIVKNVVISNKTIDVNLGDFVKLNAYAVMEDYTVNYDIKWTSSNEEAVLVSGGSIFAENEGVSTITATSLKDGTKSAVCNVNVVRHNIENKKNFLFVGDDVVDGVIGGGRQKNPNKLWDENHLMGQNFIYHINASYGSMYPQKQINFVNRGNAGTGISDLINTIKNDVESYNPEIITINTGLNDLPLVINGVAKSNTSYYDFISGYMKVVNMIKQAKPQAKIVLCEPAIGLSGKYLDGNYKEIKNVRDGYASMIKEIAEKSNAIFVPMQSAFDEAMRFSNVSWFNEGIYPSEPGQQLMADQWIKYVMA